MNESTSARIAKVAAILNTILSIFIFFFLGITSFADPSLGGLGIFLFAVGFISIALGFRMARGIREHSQGWAIFTLIFGLLSLPLLIGILWVIAAVMAFSDIKDANRYTKPSFQQTQQEQMLAPVPQNPIKRDFFERLHYEGVLNEEEMQALKKMYLRF